MGISTAYRVLGVLRGSLGPVSACFSTGGLWAWRARLIVVVKLGGGFLHAFPKVFDACLA